MTNEDKEINQTHLQSDYKKSVQFNEQVSNSKVEVLYIDKSNTNTDN